MSNTHLRIGTNGANDKHRALCGFRGTGGSTNNPPFVTCKDCLVIMQELGIEIKAVPFEYNWIINTTKLRRKH